MWTWVVDYIVGETCVHPVMKVRKENYRIVAQEVFCMKLLAKFAIQKTRAQRRKIIQKEEMESTMEKPVGH